MTARFRAPTADGGLLADPPLDLIGEQLAANAARLAVSSVTIGGAPLAEFRRSAIDEVTEVSRRYLAESGEPAPPAGTRLLMAGHQPDLFHPGVWVKNFALNAVATRHGLTPLNLVVDNDTVKGTAVRVPILSDDPAKVDSAAISFDHVEGEIPHEEYRVHDRDTFALFPDRLSKHARAWGYEPMVSRVWPALWTELERGASFGEAVSRVRRGVERQWGVTNVELPVSRLARTQAFTGFAHSILKDLPRFRECYNEAIQNYRRANRLRSKNHPAPELGVLNRQTLESPFWVWRSGIRRERLFVHHSDNGLTLYAGEKPIGPLVKKATEFGRQFGDSREGGWKIRPRALTLTLFVRMGLADGFIHGIGGGTYDQVTDDIIRGYFHMEPPGYAVVSATLRLRVPRFPATADDLRAAERGVRDLEWCPQQIPAVRSRFPELAAEKDRLIAARPEEKAARREWFRTIQHLTREMRPAVATESAAAAERLTRVRAELAANAILGSREYAWPLFPEAQLRDYFAQLR